MKSFLSVLLMLTCLNAFAMKTGEKAPDFAVADSKGKIHHLSDYAGKNLVLEWHNQGCPYVKKHYDSGNMQKIQKELTEKGFAWLTVISSAKGKQGYVTGKEADTYVKNKNANPTAVLLDADGKMGKAYGAKTTPHMFLIDKSSNVVYQGAIDNNDSSDKEDIATSKNHVTAAANELLAGKKISEDTTRPYGCGVKYE